MFIDLSQIFYLAILLFIGGMILFLRRRANGSKSLYKIVLMLTGLLVAIFLSGQLRLIKLDSLFLENLSIMMMVILMFELSIRMNPENISLKPRSIALLFGIVIVNIIVLSPVAIIILGVKALHAIVFAIIMSAIEYFFVDELREEGDLANPLIILFAFSLLFFNTLQEIVFVNLVVFLQYIIIGLGTGVLISIIVFRLLRNTRMNLFHEIILVIAVLLTYLLTEQLNGSGLFAIMIMGMFFGNSYVRQNSDMKSFSPYIIKSLEIMIFLLLGFVIIPEFYTRMIAGSIIIFLTYLLVRLIIINIIYNRYSLQNKILLTAAPKGIVYASLILVLGTSNTLPAIMINTMFLIIIYSLIISIALEYVENKKIKRIEHIFRILKNIRYGRKRDLHHKHRRQHA